MSMIQADYFPCTNKKIEPEEDPWAGVPYDELPHAVKKLKFKPPAIGVGDPVAYYIGAERNSKPAFGNVARVSGRCIEIYVIANGQQLYQSSVFHIDDPRLEDSPEIRKHGAWDYTTHQRTQERIWNELNARLDRLEKLITNKLAPVQQDEPEAEAEPVDPIRAAYETMNRTELVEWATQSGKVEPGPTWNKPTIIKRLIEAEVAPPTAD